MLNRRDTMCCVSMFNTVHTLNFICHRTLTYQKAGFYALDHTIYSTSSIFEFAQQKILFRNLTQILVIGKWWILTPKNNIKS
jgi:hypothetical protein